MPTELQMGTLRLLNEGRTIKEIAEAQGCSDSAVKARILSLRMQLGVNKVRLLVPAARKEGWL